MTNLTITGPRGIKKDILRLRSEGKTYEQIAKELSCSKGTIAYHCNKDYQKKAKARIARNRKNNIKIILANKLCQFKSARKPSTYSHEKARGAQTWNGALKNKMVRFKRIDPKEKSVKIGNFKENYGSKDVLDKIQTEDKKANCYLTGREIDLTSPATYHLDHIVPRAKGGTNDLDNLQVACKEANQAKSNMLTGEFVELCKEVLEHHGYKVTDK